MHKRFTLAACAASLLLPSVSFAADDPAAVVVTASRFFDRTGHTTAGVSVITATDIARSSATNLPEVLAKLGGAHVRNSSGDPNWQIDLRGFGASSDQNTLILLDGQRINENELTSTRLTAIPLNAIDHIEILRGSGAVLYGGGATAGTINIITRAPGSEGKAITLGASYGTYDTSDLRGGVELNAGRVGLMVNANRYASSNYRQNNRVNEDNLEGALRYRSEASELGFKFGTGRQSLGLPGPRTEAQMVSAPRAATTLNDHSNTETWHAGLVGTHRLEGNEFSVEMDVRNRQARADFRGFIMNTDTQRWSFNPRLRIPHGSQENAHELVVGWDVSRWNYRQTNNFGGLTVASQDSDAFYAQERFAPSAGTQIMAGLRVERSFNEIGAISRTSRLNALELSLRQKLADQFAAYGRYGKSYRLATVDESAFTDTGRPLMPQQSHDSEVGVEAGSGAYRLRAAWFNSNITNEIHLMKIPGFGVYGFGANSNLSPTRRTGFELEGGWNPMSSLTFGASYRHTRSSFRSGVYDGISLAGKEVPLVPRQLLTLNAAWRIGEGHSLAASSRYVGPQRYDNDQTNSFGLMPAYSLVDLKYSYTTGNWSWAISADNLFDKRYYSYGILNGAGTSFNAYPELGRRVMLSAELKL